MHCCAACTFGDGRYLRMEDICPCKSRLKVTTSQNTPLSLDKQQDRQDRDVRIRNNFPGGKWHFRHIGGTGGCEIFHFKERAAL